MTVGLRFEYKAGTETIEEPRNVRALRAGLSLEDARPSSGVIKLTVDGSPTGGIPATATEAEFQTALDAAEPGATVVKVDDSYLIEFADKGTRTFGIGADSNTLKPFSEARITEATYETETVYEVRLVQLPVAFTDSFEAVLPPAPEITQFQAGFSGDGGTLNEIQRLYVDPRFNGTYRLRRGTRKTGPIQFSQGVSAITAAVPLLLSDDEKLDSAIEVSSTIPFTADLEFTGALGGMEHDLIEAEVLGSPPGDPTFSLSLNTPGILELLRDQSTVELEMEIEAEISDKTAEAEEDEAWKVTTIYRGTVTVRREILRDGLAAVQAIDFLEPPAPKTYKPFSRDQISVGTRFSAGELGAGLVHVFPHGLNTFAIATASVRHNSAGGAFLKDDQFTVTLDTVDSATITLEAALDPVAEDDFTVIFQAAAEDGTFNAHTHTREDIDGLPEILDQLSEDIQALQDLAPSGALAEHEAAGGVVTEWTLPEVNTLLPTRERNLLVAVNELSGAELETVRSGSFLPAIHTEDAPVALPDPLPLASVDNQGIIYRNDSNAAVALPGGGGRRKYWLQPGEFASVAYVNTARRQVAAWYALDEYEDDTSASYYPKDFNVDLFEIPVTAEQLRLKRELTLNFALETALFNASKPDARAQWVLALEWGNPLEETTPGTPGLNFNSIDWNEKTPALAQRFIITPLPTVHRFGIRVKRELLDGVDTLSADALIYGDAIAAASLPVANNFILRGRLTRFDCGTEPDPRGLAAASLLSAGAEEGSSLGKAIIQ